MYHTFFRRIEYQAVGHQAGDRTGIALVYGGGIAYRPCDRSVYLVAVGDELD